MNQISNLPLQLPSPAAGAGLPVAAVDRLGTLPAAADSLDHQPVVAAAVDFARLAAPCPGILAAVVGILAAVVDCIDMPLPAAGCLATLLHDFQSVVAVVEFELVVAAADSMPAVALTVAVGQAAPVGQVVAAATADSLEYQTVDSYGSLL